MISVLMTVYNERVEWVSDAIDSVINSAADIELIIVVDNPSLPEELSKYLQIIEHDKRIRIYYNESNLGPAMSANVALSHAGGEYVARLDSDDIALENRFIRELDFLTKNGFDMVAGGGMIIDEDGVPTGDSITPEKDICRHLLFRNGIVQSTVLIRTEVIKKLNGYRNFRNSEDYDLWLRVLSNGYKIGIVPGDALSKYRIRSQSLTVSRRYEQYVLNKYVQELYWERVKNSGKDNFSDEHLTKYLKRAHITARKNKKCQKVMEILNSIPACDRKQKVSRMITAFIQDPCLIIDITLQHIKKRMRRKYIGNN